MPEHPNREIEQRLRAAAEARRCAAGGAFTLHTADRRQLQEEVARTLRQPSFGARPGWLAWLRRHRAGLAFGSGLALVLLISVPAFLQPAFRKIRERAQEPRAAVRSDSLRPEAEPKAKVEVLRSEPAPTAAAPLRPEPLAKSAPPPAAASPAPARELAAQGGGAGRNFPAEPTAARALKEASLATAIPFESQGGTVNSAMRASRDKEAAARLSVAALEANQATELLSSFRFEQRGSSVTVVVADGSIYTGAVESLADAPGRGTNAVPASRAVRAEQAPELARHRYNLATSARGKPQAQAPAADNQAWAFRVAGTNRTLQQVVVLSGSVPLPAAPAGSTQQWVRSQTPTQVQTGIASRQAAQTLPSTNSPLTGELQVGRGTPVTFEALPAAR